MSDANILREYLVKLGFKLDESQRKKFAEGLKNIEEKVVAFSKAAIAMGAVAAVAMERVTKGLSDVYFASRRTGASVANIKSFGYAISQLGGSAQGAQESLENVARNLRNSPGFEQMLNSIGVKTRDANGGLLDMVDMMKGIGSSLSGMQYSRANSLAAFMGIDENTLMAMRSGEVEKFQSQYKDMLDQMGVSYDEAAKNSRKFQETVLQLKAAFEIVRDTVVGGLAGAPLKEIWAPEIEFIKELIGYVQLLAKKFGDLMNKITGGRFGDWVGEKVAKLLASFGNKEAVAALQANGLMSMGAAIKQPSSTDARSTALAFFQKMGWSKDQAAGIVANLLHESNINPEAVGDNGKAYGIAQWHPDRQAAFKKWSGRDIRQSSLQEQLGFIHYEMTAGAESRAGQMLKAAMNARDAGAVFSRYYERPSAADAEAIKRGATAVNVAQNTNIIVQGSTDPAATGQAVANQQNRVAQDAIRNFAPLVR